MMLKVIVYNKKSNTILKPLHHYLLKGLRSYIKYNYCNDEGFLNNQITVVTVFNWYVFVVVFFFGHGHRNLRVYNYKCTKLLSRQSI